MSASQAQVDEILPLMHRLRPICERYKRECEELRQSHAALEEMVLPSRKTVGGRVDVVVRAER